MTQPREISWWGAFRHTQWRGPGLRRRRDSPAWERPALQPAVTYVCSAAVRSLHMGGLGWFCRCRFAVTAGWMMWECYVGREG